MVRYLFFLLSAIFIIGCKDDEPLVDMTSELKYSPTIIVNFGELAPSPDLPWTITERGEHISGAMLMPEEPETIRSTEKELIQEAVENDMLLAVISDRYFSYDLNQDHIQIWTDKTGNTISIPSGLAEEFEDSSWKNPLEKQRILFNLMNLYKPDLIFINLAYSKVTSVLQIADYWTDPEILSHCTVILYSLPDTDEYRGWAVIAGEQINGTTPWGLTANGVFATIRLLAGLQWENNIPESVPALSIIETLPGESTLSW
ncbi:MAG: hypothetical protein KAW14_07350 [Candidatus Aegiribacteria sp.]|nr:hypothetical protein [Candidatus Aegiribacteria sp.]